jgi:hypothetical protein
MERAGIPTVTMGYSDQINFFRNVSLTNGCPNIRWIDVPRMGSSEERVATFYDKVSKALCDPLTAKEKESGLYSPPAPPRILFEGTYDEAQDFLQQTVLVENCRMCPIAKYTDGSPVIVPTQEKVTAMLTGTTHKPTETVANPLARSATVLAGSQIVFSQNYTTTVEKVAICAVMAGCKPQYLPVALAIACTGGANTSCPGTSGPGGVSAFVVSGPISKEIGMNAGQNALDHGSPANETLGRFSALISIAGGCVTGIVRTDVGNAIHDLVFAEDIDGLPKGWEGFNEESTYYDINTKATVNFKETETVVGRVGYRWSLVGNMHSPGSTREVMAGTGNGGMARYIQAQYGIPEGTPGVLNWLDGFVPAMVLAVGRPGGRTFIFHPNMAQSLYELGFKNKASVYTWMFGRFKIDAGYYRNTGWWDFVTDSGRNIERTSGKPFNELAYDYKIPALGNSPTDSCFIVSNGGADEIVYIWEGGRPASYPVDPWR